MRHLIIGMSCLLICFATNAQFERLIVNEFSTDYIELVVVGKKTCYDSTVNLHGWILDDHNGWYGNSPGGTHVSAGHLRFEYFSKEWDKVPYGSIILVYNENKKNPKIGPDDPLDSNHDQVYIVPGDQGYFDDDNVSPADASTNGNYVYNKSPILYGTGKWSRIDLDASGDAVTLVDPKNLGTAHFSISYGAIMNGNQNPTIYKPQNLASKDNFYLVDRNYTKAASFLAGNFSNNDGTPGEPNGGDNTIWINSMRSPIKTPVLTINNPAPICLPSTIDLSAASILNGSQIPYGATITYWQDASATHPLTDYNNVSTSGTYYIKAETGGNPSCLDIKPVSVVINPQPQAPEASSLTLCQGSTISLTIGSGSNLLWYDSNTSTTPLTNNSIILTNTPGTTTYYISQLVNGCVSSRTPVDLTINPTPVAPPVNDLHLCAGSLAPALTINGNNIRWYTLAEGGTSMPAPPVVSTHSPGITTYYVTETIGVCESQRQKFDIIVNPTPAIPSFNLQQPTCGNPMGMVAVNSNTSGFLYSIDNSNPAVYPANGLPATSGTHILTIINNEGCTNSTSFSISTPLNFPPVPVTEISQPSCTVSMGNIKIVSPDSSFLYAIDATNYNTFPVTGFAVASGPHKLLVKNSQGCTTSVDFNINSQPTAPVAPIVDVIQPTCGNPLGTITIKTPISSGYTYGLNSAGYQPGTMFKNLKPAQYAVTANAGRDCISQSTIITIVTPVNTVKGIAPAPVLPCENSTATIVVAASGGTGSYTYSLNGSPFSPISQFANVKAGSYSITVMDSEGCTADVSTVITPAPKFFITLAANKTSIVQSSSVLLQASSSTSGLIYTWLPVNLFPIQNTNKQVIYPNAPIDVEVVATSPKGCLASANLAIAVSPVNDIYVPSAFTPNKDGLNDILRVIGGEVADIDFRIYNRWGEMVFNSRSIDKGWDGTLSGREQPAGVYVYLVIAQRPDGTKEQKKGTITLIR